MPIIRASQRQVEAIETSNHSAMNHEEWISEPGGLTQFGAFIHVLQPGTRSSIKHWHQLEDELVYVLDGELTIIQGDDQHLLRSGTRLHFRMALLLATFFGTKAPLLPGA